MCPNKCKEQFLVEELFAEFYQCIDQAEMMGVTAISLSLDPEKGDLTISEGSENILSTKEIYAWIASETVTAPEVEKNAIIMINKVLRDLNSEGYFEQARFGRPLTISYVDNDSGEANELLLLEDEWAPDNRPLLEGVDQELDQFLAKLLEE